MGALMPEGLEVLSIGSSTVIGVVRDELDVEQIQVHGFALPSRSSS